MDDLYYNLDSFDRYRLRHVVYNFGIVKILNSLVCNLQSDKSGTMASMAQRHFANIKRELLANSGVYTVIDLN
jgi:hypothetical protein